jgi:hypothetical protein
MVYILHFDFSFGKDSLFWETPIQSMGRVLYMLPPSMSSAVLVGCK